MMPPYPPYPPYYPPRPPAPPRRAPLLGCAFTISFLFNIVALFLVFFACGSFFVSKAGLSETGEPILMEQHFAGKTNAQDKVAIIHLDGIILEGMMKYVNKQIERAAKDGHVKAVVFRINSPGGSITASDQLYLRLKKLRDGDPAQGTKAKPLVVSMGSMAASGGYYVAVPAKTLFAERTTMTGSIGVYSAFPNVKDLGDKYGFHMNVIKQGAIKDSGSLFKEMSPGEKQVWQDFVDHAYNQFLDVVSAERPQLTRKKLLEAVVIRPLDVQPPAGVVHGPPSDSRSAANGEKTPAGPYRRYRADGGIFTADKAKELELIDEIGDLEAAVAGAAKTAGLGDNYNAVRYERHKSLMEEVLGVRSTDPGAVLDPGRLRAGLSPRVWYLAPGHEAAGVLAAVEAGK